MYMYRKHKRKSIRRRRSSSGVCGQSDGWLWQLKLSSVNDLLSVPMPEQDPHMQPQNVEVPDLFLFFFLSFPPL